MINYFIITMIKDISCNIPQTVRNEFVISSYYLIDFVKSVLLEKKYNNYNDLYNIFNEIFYNKIINASFWNNSLNEKLCSYKHKSGKYDGQYCCRKIYIESIDKYGKYLCSKHIGKIYHNIRKNNIKKEDKCINNNKYGDRCNLKGKYNKLCIHHYKDHYNLNNVNEAKAHYLNEKNKNNNINDNNMYI